MDLDTGAAKILYGNRQGEKVHAMRPPVGQGLVCSPDIMLTRLVKTDEPVTCKVCLSQINAIG
jgi:hypothetical protein